MDSVVIETVNMQLVWILTLLQLHLLTKYTLVDRPFQRRDHLEMILFRFIKYYLTLSTKEYRHSVCYNFYTSKI